MHKTHTHTHTRARTRARAHTRLTSAHNSRGCQEDTREDTDRIRNVHLGRYEYAHRSAIYKFYICTQRCDTWLYMVAGHLDPPFSRFILRFKTGSKTTHLLSQCLTMQEIMRITRRARVDTHNAKLFSQQINVLLDKWFLKCYGEF